MMSAGHQIVAVAEVEVLQDGRCNRQQLECVALRRVAAKDGRCNRQQLENVGHASNIHGGIGAVTNVESSTINGGIHHVTNYAS